MACYDNVNEILACGEGDAFWKGYTNGKFPQDSSKYNSHQINVIGGINNSKNLRTSASSFTLFAFFAITVSYFNLLFKYIFVCLFICSSVHEGYLTCNNSCITSKGVNGLV